MAKRFKNMSFRILENGHGQFTFYTRPDADGAQGVAVQFAVNPDEAIHDSLADTFALYGLRAVFASRINGLDEPTPSVLETEWQKFAAAVKSGEWTPGRDTEEREPTDLELAIAEATGRTVHDVQAQIEDVLSRPRRNAAGEPMRDKKGRIMHEHRRATVMASLADDPAVKPILARLTAERAKRLTAEAKRGGVSALAGLGFSTAPAAEAAQ